MRHLYADFIDRVAKPARYLGGEYLSVVKDWRDVDGTCALAFPDVYEIGMSHMGTKILYTLLNRDPRLACERAFTPWVDMEEELRARELPLVSLESSRPLRDFDVIGLSLQYELTYTNVLTMLDLGGVALRAADRAPGDPYVVGGGPNATHPEPMAPFFDAFFIGEAEEELPALVRGLAAGRRAGKPRLEVLAELAERHPIYVPALYETERCAETGMVVVGAPRDPRAPARVQRGVVEEIDRYPFPGDAPVPYAEAVFDRAGVEIARGCTEGCRFCQAGMIYRPVRERSPESIVNSLMTGVEKAGYDETSLTSLSTADYSCITPLVKDVMQRLRERKVSLSVSSLRAYGLNEDILDEMATMRITGLTFAPEAGTQRMRDVVNKNVTEEHVVESSHRIFQRGWSRLKLYFMIGLPTEEDDDVLGIVHTGDKMLGIGRGYAGRRAEVTVSVSSHVPKPHTPFQWCAQDQPEEIRRKQRLMRSAVSRRGLKLKVHDCGTSLVEGVFSRGDRRLADCVELAWRRGARFDGWDEHFDLERWEQVFADCGVEVDAYLDTRPVTARLPWDHIDVGLEDGFLLGEYRKALKNRLSPPCGKVKGQLIHPTNLEDAAAERGKLVCYDCGVACDLSRMREQRSEYLHALGAERRPEPREPARLRRPPKKKGKPAPPASFPSRPSRRIRLRYTKLARSAYLGHLDTARVLARLFRRADVPVAYSRGFHPQPQMAFAPALSLGVPSFGELLDVSVESELGVEEIRERLAQVSPEGIGFTGAWELLPGDPKLSKLVHAYDLLILPAPEDAPSAPDAPLVLSGRSRGSRLERVAADFLSRDRVLVPRKEKRIDVRALVTEVVVVGAEAASPLCRALGWDEASGLLRARVDMSPDGSAKPVEVARALGVYGPDDPRAPHARLARLGFPGVCEDLDPARPLTPPVDAAGAAAAAGPDRRRRPA